LEKQYAVHISGQQVGKVQVCRQGLYYHFLCRCQLPHGEPYRLKVSCGGRQENLGILIPIGDGFGLDTKIAAKHIGDGMMAFTLLPHKESKEHISGKFIPISPEEPFSYICRIRESFLTIKNGQKGIVIK